MSTIKHHLSLLYWNHVAHFGGNLHLRIHRILWAPAALGATMMNWWRQRDFEYTNPGITAHGWYPWEDHTGQRRHEGFYSKDTDPMFIVWTAGYRLHRLGITLCDRFNKLVNCDCDECNHEG